MDVIPELPLTNLLKMYEKRPVVSKLHVAFIFHIVRKASITE